MELIIKVRNSIIEFLYLNILKPIFFLIDPQIMHHKANFVGSIIGSNFIFRFINKLFFSYSNSKLIQKINGIKYNNPVGIPGGFDKNGIMIKGFESTGFGFCEIGSITALSYRGNKGRHLWRLVKLKSLVVNYGLKNEGAKKIYRRIKKKKINIPLGINVARSNRKEVSGLEDSIKDYIKTVKVFSKKAKYFCINISCPNAETGYMFLIKKNLKLLLNEIDKLKLKQPIYLKLSADLTKKEIDSIIEVSKKHNVHGFICTNLTKDRSNLDSKKHNIPKVGSLSGVLVKEKSDEVIKYIYKKTKGKYTIIGTGGIFSAKDAYQKIKYGASLVQVFTGMIYNGPQLISQINQGIVEYLEEDGYTHVNQAIGSYHN